MFQSDQRIQIIDRVGRVCNECNVEINVKKTKVKLMVFSKKQSTKCVTEVNRKELEQVSAYKYLGS